METRKENTKQQIKKLFNHVLYDAPMNSIMFERTCPLIQLLHQAVPISEALNTKQRDMVDDYVMMNGKVCKRKESQVKWIEENNINYVTKTPWLVSKPTK
jgi:hypothetical protein